jgi:hypothetical protein
VDKKISNGTVKYLGQPKNSKTSAVGVENVSQSKESQTIARLLSAGAV